MSAKEWIYYALTSPVGGYYTKNNECFHVKIEPGGFRHFSDTGITETGWISYSYYATEYFLNKGRESMYVNLDFQSNNSFELIPFLLDWDGMLASFGKKLLSTITDYGGITWGVMPLISDLKSLVASLTDIQSGMLKSYESLLGKRISRRFNFSARHEDGYFKYYCNGYASLGGCLVGDYLPPHDLNAMLAVFLDELGLHPDARTVWDVIPLSFAVDYILPVGDFLESLHPRGWFKPTISLDGTSSVKLNVNQTPKAPDSGSTCKYTVYSRKVGVSNFPSRPLVEPKFTMPSFRELFNIAFLARQRRS